MINTIGVYAASSTKVKTEYINQAYRLGKHLAEQGIGLVYGAGAVGLMGAVADGVSDNGGKTIGIIPKFMVEHGWCRQQLTERIVTESMHERKAMLAQMSDAFVALPGGIGTAEELLECMTWKQLGLHTKPIILLNVDGYYNTLLHWLDQMAEEKMMREVHKQMYVAVSDADEVIEAIKNAPKWDSSIVKIAQI